MSHTGGHTALVGMTVMNGGHGEMKWLLVLSVIHNLQLQKASLIMTAVGKERVLWMAGEKKFPVFSQNFCCWFLNPFSIPQLLQSWEQQEQLSGICGICPAGPALQDHLTLVWGLPSAHLLISQTEGKLIAYHFPLLFQVCLRLTDGFQMSLKTISIEKEGEAGRWEEIAWALFILGSQDESRAHMCIV